MSYVIDIPCDSGNVKVEQMEATVETTVTGVRWRINGKLAAAIHRMVQEAGPTNAEKDILMRAQIASRLERWDAGDRTSQQSSPTHQERGER